MFIRINLFFIDHTTPPVAYEIFTNLTSASIFYLFNRLYFKINIANLN